MFASLPLIIMLAIHLTSITQAVPLPQADTAVSNIGSVSQESGVEQSDIAANAPAGPKMTDLSSLSDLVIPQEEGLNKIAPAVKRIRSPPADLNALVGEVGDFELPSTTTSAHVARAAKIAVPSLSDAEAISIVRALRPESSRQ